MRGEKVTVKTKTGNYEGLRNDQTICFKGIQYGIVPGRWQKSVMVPDSDELKEAHEFGPASFQAEIPGLFSSAWPQSEDCLYLNIWTRDPQATKPVWVFIHGGGFCSDSTADPLYNGFAVVNDNPDVVMVTIQYRLGFFGSLALEEIGGSAYEDSGSLNILDVQLALQWVQENIAAFGGDPSEVAIMGQSAGSACVHLLGVMPGAKGLFNKLMIDSTAPTSSTKTGKQAKQIRDAFMEVCGCRSIEEMLALSPEQILEYAKAFETKGGKGGELKDRATYYAPVRDDKIIPLDVYEAYKRGDAADCKMLIGTTNGEHDVHCKEPTPIDEAAAFLDKFEVGFKLGTDYEDRLAATKEFFALDEDQWLRSMDWGCEAAFWEGSVRMAAAQAQYNDVYFWRFDWAPNTAQITSPYGRAPHCMELPFALGITNCAGYGEITGYDLPRRLVDQVQNAFLSFAAYGDPNGPKVPAEWPKYDSKSRSTMIIDEEWHVEDDPHKEDRLIFEKIFVK